MSTNAQQAVAAYRQAREQARQNPGGQVARAVLAHAFEAALAAVFDEAKPSHGLDARLVKYRQIQHGMHIADFTRAELYEVSFHPDLKLGCVDRVRDWRRVWPLRKRYD